MLNKLNMRKTSMVEFLLNSSFLKIMYWLKLPAGCFCEGCLRLILLSALVNGALLQHAASLIMTRSSLLLPEYNWTAVLCFFTRQLNQISQWSGLVFEFSPGTIISDRDFSFTASPHMTESTSRCMNKLVNNILSGLENKLQTWRLGLEASRRGTDLQKQEWDWVC